MSQFLSDIKKRTGVSRSAKRRGRGHGSGKGGHTVGRGNKGQKARTGGQVPNWFEGGQSPLVRKLPFYGGFHNPRPKNVLAVNLSRVQALFPSDKVLTPAHFAKKGLFKESEKIIVKILGRGTLESAKDFSGFSYTKKAKIAIEKLGGKAE